MDRKLVVSMLVVVSVVFCFSIFAVSAEPVKVNINTASADELSQLKGVGAKYAAKIVEYREKNGPFKSPQDLMNVQGIGSKTFEANKEMISIE